MLPRDEHGEVITMLDEINEIIRNMALVRRRNSSGASTSRGVVIITNHRPHPANLVCLCIALDIRPLISPST